MTVCSIIGCKKPSFRRGYCSMHNSRIKNHGDPHFVKSWRGGITAFWINIFLESDHRTEECIFSWPFSKDKMGYPWATWKGKRRYTHRIICEEIHGPHPVGKDIVRHICGNGHKGCINPKHLAWSNKQENEKDKEIHGTLPRGERQGGSKLKESDIPKILSLRAEGRKLEEIGSIFGVHFVTISDVIEGRSWGWLTGRGK